MAPHNRKPGGWVLPGYKYLGPFNPIKNGKPINKADAAARRHDLAYDQYLKEGKNPYLYFNKADQKFLDELKGDYSIGGLLGKGAFHIKKAIAPELAGDKPRKTPQAQKRHLYFLRSHARAAKQKKMDGAANPDNAGEGTSNQAVEPVPRSISASGGGGGGGGGGGMGGSVGISTGGWTAGTYFGDNVIITNVTRQWYAPIYNQHLYKKIDTGGDWPTPNNTEWRGMSTPWGYFNFNCYHSHFSPQDWQRMVNEYKAWRPRKMHVKIYNLQIKQVVQLGLDTLYNNDLTAGVHIFCDGSHQYPYAQHPWDESTLPELPNTVYKLPQYAYFQNFYDMVDTAATRINEKRILQGIPLYMLEHSSHEVLRTGEETEFSFDFDCQWMNNDRAFCPPQADFNPLVKTRRAYARYIADTNTQQATIYSPFNKPSNWLPGPAMFPKGDMRNTDNPAAAKGPFITTWHPTGTEQNLEVSTGQGVMGSNIPNVYSQGLSTQPVTGASSLQDSTQLIYNATDNNNDNNTLYSTQIDTDMNRFGEAWRIQMTATNDAAVTKINDVWMFPNQTWNEIPFTRDTPIWDKVPRADKHTLLTSADGTIPMTHPPGTIFVKVAKIPIPTANNTDSYLNIYVTGQVTCQILWEAQRYQTKNWRPEPRIDAASFASNAETFNFNNAGQYIRTEEALEGMPTKFGIARVN